MWQPGTQVDRYVIESRLGAGAMGVVWLARHQDTGAQVALKTVPAAATGGLVERFRREGQAQAAVDGHPNVVRVLGAGEAHGFLYLAMEVVTGGDLLARVKLGPLAAREGTCIATACSTATSSQPT
jgi:eukaryotic-like serine/threonine-protein kinase